MVLEHSFSHSGSINAPAINLEKLIFPENLKEISIPTFPGAIRRILNYKLMQIDYCRKNKIKVVDYMLSHLRSEMHSQFYENWKLRGMREANSLGIALPSEYPRLAYDICEVIGDRVYETEGFLPGSSTIVVDVGAQYGDFTILCSKIHQAKHVHAFEPIPENVQIMRDFLSLNNASNVSIHECGLSDEDTTMELSFTGSMLQANRTGITKKTLEFRRLDSLSLKPDLLKIDVEGYELHVLKGGLDTLINNRPRLIVEVHSLRLGNEVTRILRMVGYKVAKRRRFPFLNGNIENIFFEPVS